MTLLSCSNYPRSFGSPGAGCPRFAPVLWAGCPRFAPVLWALTWAHDFASFAAFSANFAVKGFFADDRRLLRLLRRRVLLRLSGHIVVNRILLLRTLQFDHNVLRPGIDFVILPIRLKAGRQHLHPQLAVGNALKVRLAVAVGLEFEPAPSLLPMRVHRMQHHRRIAYRLPVIFLDHEKAQRRRRFPGPSQYPNYNEDHQHPESFHDRPHSKHPDPTCHLALTSNLLEARPHSKAYLRDIPS